MRGSSPRMTPESGLYRAIDSHLSFRGPSVSEGARNPYHKLGLLIPARALRRAPE